MADSAKTKKHKPGEAPSEGLDPDNWPALVWRVFQQLGWLGAIVIVVAYFAARVYEMDPLNLPVSYVQAKLGRSPAKASVAEFPPRWRYTCVTPDAKWGGEAQFTVRQRPWGTEVSIVGERKWQLEKGVQGGERRIALDPPIAWSSEGGTFTSDDAIQWFYQTSPDNLNIAGLTRVKVIKKDGQIVKMNGLFSTVFASKPTYGQIELVPEP
jgi:hypothetical protein